MDVERERGGAAAGRARTTQRARSAETTKQHTQPPDVRAPRFGEFRTRSESDEKLDGDGLEAHAGGNLERERGFDRYGVRRHVRLEHVLELLAKEPALRGRRALVDLLRRAAGEGAADVDERRARRALFERGVGLAAHHRRRRRRRRRRVQG